MKKLGLLFGWMGVGIAFCFSVGLPARAARFGYKPDISDRKVVLTWRADSTDTALAPDPFHSGNAVLKLERQQAGIHGANAVREMFFASGGDEAYSRAQGDVFLRHWDLATGLGHEPDFIDLSGLDVVASSLHSSEAFYLAALGTQEVALWQLRRQPPVMTRTATPARILALQFLPAAADTQSLRFVSVSDDSLIRVWRKPGVEITRSKVVGGATSALALVPRPASNDFFFAAGTATGRIRIWNSAALGTASLILGDQDPHPSEVVRVAFSPDAKRLASIDAGGEVRIWRLSDGARVGGFQAEEPALFVAFSPPYGALLLAGLRDGTLEARSGFDGSFYKRENFVQKPLTAMELSPGGGRLLLGDAGGGVSIVRAGFCKAGPDQPSCFGGYMVWRSDVPDPAQKVLMRVYTFGDSTWNFTGPQRSFADPDSIIKRTSIPLPGRDQVIEDVVVAGPHNGVPYYYSVTRFDFVYLAQGTFEVLRSLADSTAADSTDAVLAGYYRDQPGGEPTPIICRPGARSDTSRTQPPLGEVRVVPNPYEKGKSNWELPGEMHIEFQNLPAKATVWIYTLGGDFVRELRHDLDRYNEPSSVLPWDLKNTVGRWVTSGVYVYQIKSPTGEVEQGYFTVIM